MLNKCCVYERKSIQKGSTNQITLHHFPDCDKYKMMQTVENENKQATKHFQSLKYSYLKCSKESDSEDTGSVKNAINCTECFKILSIHPYSQKARQDNLYMAFHLWAQEILTLNLVCLIWVMVLELGSYGSETQHIFSNLLSDTLNLTVF